MSVHRGAGVESEHRVAWATTDSDGGRAGMPSAAYPGPRIFARSASKPFQALRGVRAGVPERFGLASEHLALACASHGGSDGHVERVREILRAAGRTETDLACGAGEPRDPAASLALRDAGGRPDPVRHNCSGKHAFGVAFAVAEGWPVEGYIDAGHPLQVAMEARHGRGHAGRAGRAGSRSRRLRDADLLGPDRAARGGVRTARLGRSRGGRRAARGGDDRPPGARRLRRRARHGADAGAPAAREQDRRRGRAGHRPARRPRRRAQGARRRHPRARPRRAAAARGALGHRASAAPASTRLRDAPVVNSRGERVGRAEATLAA